MESNFKRNECVGEVIATSLDEITIAFWPTKTLHFGSLITIYSEPKAILGIIVEIWQESLIPSRQIIPLQLSFREIENAYPHLNTQIAFRAKAILFGTQILNIDTQFSKYCPKLHAWIKEQNSSEMTKTQLLKCLDKIISEEISSNKKECLFTVIANEIFKNNTHTDEPILDKLYLLATKAFCNDFSKISSLFNKATNYKN